MKIVFVTTEAVPFAKTGGLADVCGTLPQALEELGHEVTIIMPHFHCVGAQSPFNDQARMTTIGHNIKVFFLINRKFFDRPRLYGDPSGDYEDNLDRFSFFCRQTMEFLKGLGTPVDIIHCHDWQTGLIPVLLKETYRADPFFARTRSVFTIHNLAYQGMFPVEEYPKLGVDGSLFNHRQMEFYGKINLVKTAIVFSDKVTTVSPQYAREIQTQEFGCGLEGVLQTRRGHIAGILNGLDYELWDPQTDELISPNYSGQDWGLKQEIKIQLQEMFGLTPMPEIPMFGFVGRLCHQKGLDLIEHAIEELMQRPVQLVFLGIGEDRYQKLLAKLARQYPQKFGALIRYDENISHMVYAGSDFFLMPSVYEPCGLTQMISLRYGTIPLVSHVGGLADTVTDVFASRSGGNGLVMPTYSVSGLLETVDRAVGVYNQKERMQALIAHAMASRWTWEASAQHYVECYRECLK